MKILVLFEPYSYRLVKVAFTFQLPSGLVETVIGKVPFPRVFWVCVGPTVFPLEWIWVMPTVPGCCIDRVSFNLTPIDSLGCQWVWRRFPMTVEIDLRVFVVWAVIVN